MFFRAVVSRKYKVGQEESPLAHIEEISSLEYELETEYNTRSVLLS